MPGRHTAPMPFTVTVCHDEEEGVWFVQSSDLPGLIAEAPMLDALIEVITDVVPDLVATNIPDRSGLGPTISICVQHIVNTPRANEA